MGYKMVGEQHKLFEHKNPTFNSSQVRTLDYITEEVIRPGKLAYNQRN
jgi:hypothetical protein